VSPENSADHPLASAFPEAPVIPEADISGANGIPANGIELNGATVLAGTDLAASESPAESALQPSLVSESVLAESTRAPEPADGPPVRGTLAEWMITILLLLFLTTMLVQAFVIPTGSMEDTLLIGDHLLVDKMATAPAGPISKYILPYREPKRGDIIVFRYPTDIQQTFVKRCMGIPGDRIHIVNKQVYVNGHRLDEPYKYNKTDYFEDYRDNFPSEPNVTLEPGAVKMLQNNVLNGEIVVPANSYFAMGDNRDSSWDSRFWGFVPRQNIIGKPLIIYWSYDRPSDQLNTNSISLPQILDLATHFFSKTRWRRSFQLIHGYPVQ
jgi:signal peptidase I